MFPRMHITKELGESETLNSHRTQVMRNAGVAGSKIYIYIYIRVKHSYHDVNYSKTNFVFINEKLQV